jgi:neutral ceramidase
VIKKRSPFKRTFVSELANGWVGYVPTKRAFEQNMKDVPSDPMKTFDHKGYEVRSALSRGFLPGVGEVMADTAIELLEKLY